MKKSTIRVLTFVLTATVGAHLGASAQSMEKDKKTTIQVRVVEENSGKTNTYERRYRLDPMSDAEQKAFIDKVLDSLSVDSMSQKQIRIRVDDERDAHRGDPRMLGWNDNGRGFRLDTNELQSSMRRMQKEWEPKMRQLQKDWEPKMRALQKEFEPKMRELQREMEPGMNALRDNLNGVKERYADSWGDDSDQSNGIRSLHAYANNPDNGLLNLRFSAPDKGDVTITVTDIQGKEVGSRTIKDFSGEFIGQIELRKNTKGNLFVRVVQNEDGAVRKVTVR